MRESGGVETMELVGEEAYALPRQSRHSVMAPMTVRVSKRAFDVVCAVFGLIVFSPAFLIAMLAIRFDSPGPVFFRQMRIGQGSEDRTQLFCMVKFRTMRVNTDSNASAVWATKNDKRITKTGKFLRGTRIDELPQLWNVLKGEMSLIGPRPEQLGIFGSLERSVPFYSERAYGVRPGITGWAQVEVGYDKCLDDVKQKMLCDFAYAMSIRSFADWLRTDLAILGRTLMTVVRREGT